MADPDHAAGIDLAQLRALAEKATPGPWWTHNCFPDAIEAKEKTVVGDSAAIETDAAFIANANPQTILSLLSALEQEQAEVARLREAATEQRERVKTVATIIENLWCYDKTGAPEDEVATDILVEVAAALQIPTPGSELHQTQGEPR